jgi:hypothetical protein
LTVLIVLVTLAAIVVGVVQTVNNATNQAPPSTASRQSSKELVPTANASVSKEAYVPSGKEAFYAAQDFIEKQLKAPSTAKFSKLNWDEKTGWKAVTTNRWKVGGFVDAQNAFGAMLRSDWLAVVDWTGTNYYLSYWRLGDQESGTMPALGSGTEGSVDAFLVKYGKPDSEDTTAYDTPRPPMVTRFLIYEPEHVRVVCIPDAKVGEPPPYSRWILVGFQDPGDNHVLTVDEVEQRLAGRKKP